MVTTHQSPIFTAAEMRENLAEILNRAAYGQERIVVTRHGKELVAVVPIADLEELERLEDEIDRQEIERSLQSIREEGTIPWETVRVESGLE
ncbi:MAG: type II toxin-antitoxin system Phd/YefM family antitoxin [Thermomicrobiales bacterium]|nr:type II toxin-antitoxin system Phd/YefM family antitoxin [Thermomicrobiales bacterium]MCO5221817.1 type II toxin-antitoxin system Phd/YefM family antitoxin [Thermomicrobiales bacterium]